MHNFIPVIDAFLHPWYETLNDEFSCESCSMLNILFAHSQRIVHKSRGAFLLCIVCIVIRNWWWQTGY